MHVILAYCIYDHRGYRLDNAEKYFGVTVQTIGERSNSGTSFDEKLLKIEARSGGGAFLKNPSFEIHGSDIVVKGYSSNLVTEPPPEGSRGPTVAVMQEWLLRVNPTSDEQEEYEAAMKKADAKDRKRYAPYAPKLR
jgi:hypothetical protein